MIYEKKIEIINKDLNLIDTPDWGIINSKANRLNEFINYYNETIIDEKTKIEFIDLICSSMNAAILEEKVDCKLKYKFTKYLYSIEETEINLMILVNWASYDSNDIDEYPVSIIIEKMLNERGFI